jgi:hypothetical protein
VEVDDDVAVDVDAILLKFPDMFILPAVDIGYSSPFLYIFLIL